MPTAGIVAEYNPFHRGHAYHIAQTRRLLGEETGIVCVMSGHWVQRGECALTDKWRRAALALAGGADLVLELPTAWAMASAETFARGAVGLLAATGVVDTLSFGSEGGEAAPLRAAADCLDSPDYRQALRRGLEQGLPFAQCRQAAVAQLLGPEIAACLARPNDNLGVEYLRACPPNMGALAVPRVGAAHDGAPQGGYASASALRAWIRGGREEEAAPYLTGPWQGETAELARCERAILARLRAMGEADFAALPDSGAGEGLPRRLCRAARAACSLEEFYTLAKTKRYAHARLRRLAVGAFLGVGPTPPELPYLRVLGLNDRGRALLRQMGTRAALPVVTKPARADRLPPAARDLFAAEGRYTDLYALCFPQPLPCGLEWTRGPVVEQVGPGEQFLKVR